MAQWVKLRTLSLIYEIPGWKLLAAVAVQLYSPLRHSILIAWSLGKDLKPSAPGRLHINSLFSHWPGKINAKYKFKLQISRV